MSVQVEGNGIQTGEWKTGICGCLDSLVPNCCMSWLCPCVSVAQISNRMGLKSFKNVLLTYGALQFILYLTQIPIEYAAYPALDPEQHGLTLAIERLYERAQFYQVLSIFRGVVYFIMIVYVMQLRIQVRQRFSIPGDSCNDCLCSCCCHCCVIAQMASHVQSFRPGHCSFSPVEVLPPMNAPKPPTTSEP